MTMQPMPKLHAAVTAPRQVGFATVAAILIVVMLSTMIAAVIRITWTQNVAFAQDVMGAKAFQAANAGTEYGMYQALKGSWAGPTCATSSSTLDLTADTGFKVTVTCSTRSYNEGQTGGGSTAASDVAVRLYVIEAVACNGSGVSCPDDSSANKTNYVERKRQTVVSQTDNGF